MPEEGKCISVVMTSSAKAVTVRAIYSAKVLAVAFGNHSEGVEWIIQNSKVSFSLSLALSTTITTAQLKKERRKNCDRGLIFIVTFEYFSI